MTGEGVTRRQALQLGAAAAGSQALAAIRTAAVVGRQERSFDDGWLFFQGDVSGGQEVSFDDSSWRALDLPHDWSIEDLPYATSTDGAATSDPSLLVYPGSGEVPGAPAVIGPFDLRGSAGGGPTGYTVGGIGWYRKHFSRTEPATDARVELRFDGVYQNADVWLNGVHLGFHPYGYTAFAYDLTPQLKTGPNVLAVRVDTSGRNSRWYSGSGIYRHTWLTVTGPVRIPLWGVQVTTPVAAERGSIARVAVSVANLGALPASAAVRVTVLDRHGHVAAVREAPARAVPAAETAVSTLDLPVERAALWSPDSPSLYTARAEVLVGGRVADTATTTFGFRSLTWSGTDGLLLNGRPVQVTGGCLHHDNGPMGAVALDRSERRRVELLKAAGFTAIRTAHNPPSPALLDACDRLGMLVMDEFADMWDIAKNPQDYSVYFAEWWQRDLTGMVLRDRNHPSVFVWSLGNEIYYSGDGPRGAEMAALLRTLDTTRPITKGGGATFGAADASWDYVDIGDVHYNANGAGYASIHAAHPDKPMAESESFPAAVYQDAAFVKASPWALGTWVWAAWDYLGEAGLGKTPVAAAGTAETIGDQWANPGWAAARVLYRSYAGYGYPYPFFQANCGDLDLIGQPKPQNRWRAAVTGRSPVELLVQRPTPAGTEQESVWWGYYDELASWTWDVEPARPMVVHVYTPGDSARLLLNGTPIGTAVPDRCVATFTVPYHEGALTAIAARGGREIGRTTLRTAGPAHAVRLRSDVRGLSTSRDDLAHVLVEITDAAGRIVPDAVVEVGFEVGGAGELAAVGNGNPHNVDSFRLPRRHTWHGQALAILRPARSPGRLTLTATAAGLRPATLTLPVTPERAR